MSSWMRNLGERHPLVAAEERLAHRRRQLLATAACAVGAAGALAADARWGAAAALASAAVLAGVLVALWHAVQLRREAAIDVIVAGRDDEVAAPVVGRERRRLQSARLRARLAASLERAVQESRRWDRVVPFPRPPVDMRHVRFVSRELDDVASLLRGEERLPPTRGVALVERLVTDGYASPLYGGKAEELREELRRIRYLLQTR